MPVSIYKHLHLITSYLTVTRALQGRSGYLVQSFAVTDYEEETHRGEGGPLRPNDLQVNGRQWDPNLVAPRAMPLSSPHSTSWSASKNDGKCLAFSFIASKEYSENEGKLSTLYN